MDAWNKPDRERLRLDAAAVICARGEDGSGASVVLERPQLRQRIACDDPAIAARIAAFLEWMRLPEAQRGPFDDPDWDEAGLEPGLLSWLDANTWLMPQADEAAVRALDAQRTKIAARIDTAVAALLADADAATRARLRDMLTGFVDADAHRDTLRAACAERSQELAALRLSLGYYASNAPMLATALHAASARALHALGAQTAAATVPTAFAETDPAALDVALTQWHAFLLRAATAPRPLVCAGLDPRALGLALGPATGARFAHEAEVFADAALERLGPNPYLARLRALDDGRHPLLAGLAIEEFHVTRRFVEIIAPMLSRRLAPDLRALMFRYYAEEVGHEAFEEDTCLAHGIDRGMLDASLPLPLHATFVDAFTVAAQQRPLAFLCAVMVTEGLFARPSPLGEQVRILTDGIEAVHAVCTRHNELNECLHHDTITRHALGRIEALDADARVEALRGMALLLELNARTWEDLTAFYGASPALALHGFLGQRIETPRGRAADSAGA